MKHKNALVIAAGLSLAACATLPEATPVKVAPATYKALGTEPFWALDIQGNQMRFSRAGETDVSVSGAVSRPSFNGWRYVSKTMTTDVTFTPCSDGMSDRTYKDTVTVKMGKETYKGCGGGVLPPVSLERTVWRVAAINGTKIPATQGAQVSFGDGRMSGSVGCNRLGADYTYAASTVGFGPVMSTRMACQEPLTSQEYAFVSLLGSSPATSFTNQGALVLTSNDGATVIFEQSI